MVIWKGLVSPVVSSHLDYTTTQTHSNKPCCQVKIKLCWERLSVQRVGPWGGLVELHPQSNGLNEMIYEICMASFINAPLYLGVCGSLSEYVNFLLNYIQHIISNHLVEFWVNRNAQYQSQPCIQTALSIHIFCWSKQTKLICFSVLNLTWQMFMGLHGLHAKLERLNGIFLHLLQYKEYI